MRTNALILGSLSLCFNHAVLGQSPTPAPGPQLITHGSNDGRVYHELVNEPAAAFMFNNAGFEAIMVVYQVQDVPAGGATEAPLYLDYAIGTLGPFGNIVWEIKGKVPGPPSSQYIPQFDPTVARVLKDQDAGGGGGFVGGAAGFVPDDPNVFAMRTGPSLDEFDPPLSQTFGCIARYTRIGSDRDVYGNIPVHLLARSTDLDELCAAFGQVLLRPSFDGGQTWDDNPPDGWYLVSDAIGPVKGYPSTPQFYNPLLFFSYFSYQDEQASYIRVTEITDGITPTFTDLGLNIDPIMNVGPTERYFDVANEKLRGVYEIGPFSSIAVTDDGNTIYVVYHDLSAPVAPGDDGDFDVFLLKGTKTGGVWTWLPPVLVNAPDTGTRSDQFMPTITLDDQDRLHIAYYDTRGDTIRGDIKIGLTYTWSTDGVTFTEMPLDNDVINGSYLLNEQFFGDHIDIVWWTNEDIAVVVYTGTTHPQQVGRESEGTGGGPTLPEQNEAILMWRIDWN